VPGLRQGGEGVAARVAPEPHAGLQHRLDDHLPLALARRLVVHAGGRKGRRFGGVDEGDAAIQAHLLRRRRRRAAIGQVAEVGARVVGGGDARASRAGPAARGEFRNVHVTPASKRDGLGTAERVMLERDVSHLPQCSAARQLRRFVGVVERVAPLQAPCPAARRPPRTGGAASSFACATANSSAVAHTALPLTCHQVSGHASSVRGDTGK
jgi:hypothetical protein